MHPVIAQAIVAERTRDIRAHAAVAGRIRQLRRAGQARRMWLFAGTPRTGRAPASLPAPRSLRGPKEA
jgi:hypothetical protein